MELRALGRELDRLAVRGDRALAVAGGRRIRLLRAAAHRVVARHRCAATLAAPAARCPSRQTAVARCWAALQHSCRSDSHRHRVTPPAPCKPEARRRVGGKHDREREPEPARRVEPRPVRAASTTRPMPHCIAKLPMNISEVERGVRARGKLVRKALVQHREREDVRRWRQGHRAPTTASVPGSSARIAISAERVEPEADAKQMPRVERRGARAASRRGRAAT